MGDVFVLEPTPAEKTAHQSFRALMLALAQPGEPQRLPEPGLAAAGECLLDLEVGFFSSDAALQRRLSLTGAQCKPAEQADYLFLSAEESLGIAQKAKTGDMIYPDQAAMIFLAVRFGHGQPLTLTGPGIPVTRTIDIDDVPSSFWQDRAQACQYPRGWDLLLIDGATVVGLPRSTQVEVASWPT